MVFLRTGSLGGGRLQEWSQLEVQLSEQVLQHIQTVHAKYKVLMVQHLSETTQVISIYNSIHSDVARLTDEAVVDISDLK